MMADFGLPVVLIIFDTARKAAGATKEGADNDTTYGQNIIKALEAIAKEANAFVIGTDHFGKDISTGTRGASSKEDDADLVLAMLGERTTAGTVTNPRLAIRKRRTGENGLEFPFEVKIVETGKDEQGRPNTTLTIAWKAPAAHADTAAPKDGWASKAMRPLRQAIVSALDDHGRVVSPYNDDFAVKAVDVERVREEFYRSIVADGDREQKQDTRRKAFKRAIEAARDRSLIGIREVSEVMYVWLAKE